MENKQYLIKYDGSGRVLLRTRGHLRKMKPCTRSSGLLDMDPVEREEIAQEESPLHIPGAMPAGRVLYSIHGHEEGLQGADQGAKQGMDNMDPGE